MEQLKVRKRENIVMNVIIHLFLSFIFLYLQYAYRHHLSPFSLVYLRKSIGLFWYVAVPIAISCFLIWKHHRLSLFSYMICTFFVGFKVVEGLFIEFNKIIVIALFFYIVISYFLYQLLSYYLSLSSINSNYSASDLFDPLLTKIDCTLVFDGGEVSGFLTNWDEEGCFVHLSEAKSLPAIVNVSVNFQGRKFDHTGEVVAEAQDLYGVGIKFKKKSKDLNVFNWSEFTELVHELGFKPERLR